MEKCCFKTSQSFFSRSVFIEAGWWMPEKRRGSWIWATHRRSLGASLWDERQSWKERFLKTGDRHYSGL